MTIETKPARILVIGGGVNGSVCAVGLCNAGFDVTILARGNRFAEIRSEGIIIEDPLKNTRTVTRVPLTACLNPEDEYDYILVIVRKNQVGDLLPVLARNGTPNIVFMVNNPSGPDEYTGSLGKDRVMLGFVFAGGKRDGNVIRAMRSGRTPTPFGEINGETTPRLTRLVAILRQAGFNAVISAHMVDWQATHAAMVAPIASLTLKHGCDNYALARASVDLRLLVDAERDTLDVLEAVGRRITPPRSAIVRVIPRFILVAGLRKLLSSRIGEIGIAWHCFQAPDEMRQLMQEVQVMIGKSGLPVPALKKALVVDERTGQV